MFSHFIFIVITSLFVNALPQFIAGSWSVIVFVDQTVVVFSCLPIVVEVVFWGVLLLLFFFFLLRRHKLEGKVNVVCCGFTHLFEYFLVINFPYFGQMLTFSVEDDCSGYFGMLGTMLTPQSLVVSWIFFFIEKLFSLKVIEVVCTFLSLGSNPQRQKLFWMFHRYVYLKVFKNKSHYAE